MNETAVLDELISRHFDEALDASAHDRLVEALTSDPTACRAFAETARLHAGLESLAPPLPPVRKRPLFKLIALGSAAAGLVVGAGLLSVRPPGGARVTITMEDLNAAPDGESPKPGPPGVTKRVIKAVAAAQPAGTEAPDVEKLLSRYYVDISPQGLPISQALLRLEEAIKFENAFRRPELDQLTFSTVNSPDAITIDPLVYTPEKAPMTVRRYLETCSLYGRVIQGSGLAVGHPNIPLGLSNQTGPPVVQEYRVPADFLADVVNAGPYPEGNATAAKLSRNFGIHLAEGESATFSSVPPTLTLLAAPGKQMQLAIRLDILAGKTPDQYFLTNTYLRLPRRLLPLGFDEAGWLVMATAELVAFLKSVEASPGTVYTAPSLICRAGQEAMIEMTDEIGGRPKQENNVGLRQNIKATPSGELFRVEGLINLMVLEKKNMPGGMDVLGLQSTNVPGVTVPGIQSFKTSYEVWLPDRSTALFVVDSPQPEGFVTLVCLTVTAVDPTGTPVAR